METIIDGEKFHIIWLQIEPLKDSLECDKKNCTVCLVEKD